MINTVKSFLKKYNLADKGKTLIVAFSGGFDSSAMLDVLFKLQKEFDFKLCAAHLNHGWRQEADAEEEACRSFCQERNIAFFSEKLDSAVPKTETATRTARYEFFERSAKHFGSNIILTAHTKSDNAETILYRIARGTGISGLCAIKEKRTLNEIEIFRPILSLSREDIETYCVKNNLTPNNDTSNADTKYKRNLIRHEILPLLTKINPNTINALNNLAENASEEEDIVNEYLSKIKQEIFEENKIKTELFLKLSPSVKQRIVYDFVLSESLDYDKKKVLNILAFILEASKLKTGKTLSLTDNLWLFCSSKELYTINAAEKKETLTVEIKDFENDYKFDNYIFSIKKVNETFGNFPKENENYALVDLSKQTFLELRYRKNGDIIQPFGMPHTTKLKKYFINKNIPKHKKDSIVLLCNQNEVLWAHTVGLSEKLRVTGKPTHNIRIEEV